MMVARRHRKRGLNLRTRTIDKRNKNNIKKKLEKRLRLTESLFRRKKKKTSVQLLLLLNNILWNRAEAHAVLTCVFYRLGSPVLFNPTAFLWICFYILLLLLLLLFAYSILYPYTYIHLLTILLFYERVSRVVGNLLSFTSEDLPNNCV